MVDRAETLAGPDLRLKIVENVAALAQLDDAKLPDGARIVVQESDPLASPEQRRGQREFVFTRLPAPAAPALVFVPSSGAQALATRNAYLSKGGYLYIAWPQIYAATLNGVTPVTPEAITYVGDGTTAPSVFPPRLSWRRTTIPTTPGTVRITNADNQLVILSDAGDDGDILIQLYAVMEYPQ